MPSIFAEIPCLTERSAFYDGRTLHKKWFKKADKRYLAEVLQKFLDYNSKSFSFLGISAKLSGTDKNVGVFFKTSSYIGAIPLRSPDTGRQIGDFLVIPRFTRTPHLLNFSKIYDYLGNDISPEIINSLPLRSKHYFQPPFYLKALEFLEALERLVRTTWVKFNNVQKTLSVPSGEVQWDQYARDSYQVENRLKFPSRKNELNANHLEYRQIRYVFDRCEREIHFSQVPKEIQQRLKRKIHFLKQELYVLKPQKVNQFKIHSADSSVVKNCKEKANVILQNKFDKSTAWRIDFTIVFERVVQHVFQSSALQMGARFICNPKIKAYSQKIFSWQLNHLEPDAILKTEHLELYIDAKYKANLFNKFSSSENLKDVFRHDLHQILAYTTFNENKVKYAAICYPSHQIEVYRTKFVTPLTQAKAYVLMFGIPLKVDSLESTKKMILNQIKSLRFNSPS